MALVQLQVETSLQIPTSLEPLLSSEFGTKHWRPALSSTGSPLDTWQSGMVVTRRKTGDWPDGSSLSDFFRDLFSLRSRGSWPSPLSTWPPFCTFIIWRTQASLLADEDLAGWPSWQSHAAHRPKSPSEHKAILAICKVPRWRGRRRGDEWFVTDT